MIVLAGPTASGKSALAVALAERLGAEIVSADSRQVYRKLDAGTAKPTAEQRRRVAHHLLDLVEPSEAYDAGRFVRDARAALEAIAARGKRAIVCGGTGLYLKALLEGLAPLPPRDETVRRRLAKLDASQLHARLSKADPAAAAGIPRGNTQRLVRALEVLELTGRPISAHWAAGRAHGVAAEAVLVLELDKAALDARIERRAEAMWPAMLDEVRWLVPKEHDGSEPGFTSLGYPQALAAASGRKDPAAMLDEMTDKTVQYAKRQRTWFRGQLPDATRLDAASKTLLDDALEALHEKAARS
ncbi:MAG: tRNA (adenosine(37)-N6)-dimethylallyltransferase MiaA [Elusimicrobiota bacterium]|nr:tRNA (adenosine(37)-N6)-dimethylallyltransferase MiaA [Elusimicrobiota bacterium]